MSRADRNPWLVKMAYALPAIKVAEGVTYCYFRDDSGDSINNVKFFMIRSVSSLPCMLGSTYLVHTLMMEGTCVFYISMSH
jgi:hypothetical protein